MSSWALSGEASLALRQFFHNDYDKFNRWLQTENPLLGGITPNAMLLAGRGEKLSKFILQCLSENKPQGSQPSKGGK